MCAVSATGHGEYFIRAVAAHHICARGRIPQHVLEAAVRELIHETIPALGGGGGGIIAVGARGELVMDFSTQGMFRAAQDSKGQRTISIQR